MKTPAFHGVPVLFLPFTWLLGCVRSYPKRIENRLIRLSVPKEASATSGGTLTLYRHHYPESWSAQLCSVQK